MNLSKTKMGVMDYLNKLNPIYNLNKELEFAKSQIDEFKKSSMSQSKTFTSSPSPMIRDFSVDTQTIQQFSLEDNYLRATINKRVNKIMAGGYIIEAIPDKPNSELQLGQFEEWERIAGGRIEVEGENINFVRVLRKTCFSLTKGDDFYWELVLPKNLDSSPIENEFPRSIHVLDWEEMSIKHDGFGNLIPLIIQDGRRMDGPFKQIKGGRVVAIWDKSEIIHANYFGEGTSKYGMPLARSALFAATTKRKAELFSADIFEKSKVRGHWEIDADDLEFEKIKAQILESVQKPNMDIFTQTSGRMGEQGPAVKYQDLITPKDLEFEKSITTSREDIPVSMGVPMGSIFAPAKKSGWEAQTELHEFDEDINAVRDFLERIINNQLFQRYGWDAIKITFNKANKRDEEKEAKISRLTSDILTINERRQMIGKEEIEGGDIIIPSSNTIPSGSAGSEPNEELSMSVSNENLNNIIFKAPIMVKKRLNYFRKSFSSDGRLKDINSFQKILDTRKNKQFFKPPIGQQEKTSFNKLFKLRNDYVRVVKNEVDNFINKVVNDVVNNLNSFRKIKDPEDKLKDIDKTISETMPRVSLAVNSIINDAYNFGIERAEIHTGITLAKSTSVDINALEFLERMNINVLEGEFSEMANRVKTQIRLGLESQESTAQIARRIKGNTAGVVERIYKNRFQNIARTELSRAVIHGRLNGYEQSGVVERVEGLIGAYPDGLCHKTLEGKTFTLEESRGIIPVHVNCSCDWIVVTKDF